MGRLLKSHGQATLVTARPRPRQPTGVHGRGSLWDTYGALKTMEYPKWMGKTIGKP